MMYQLKINSQDFIVDVGPETAGSVQVGVNGKRYDVVILNTAMTVSASAPVRVAERTVPHPEPVPPVSGTPQTSLAGDGLLCAPIPGLIVAITVRVGDTVQAGQAVAIMEAMKMENELAAGISGVVTEIMVEKGAEVSTGDPIMRIE
jgi:biotin carboxyl carrier protein